MQRASYEAIVIGCGGIGSAAMYWLSRELGDNVLGLERFRLGHDHGASQDHSRIIRLTYHDPVYVALAAPAYEHWRVVEAESGIQLLTITGGLDLQVAGTSGIKDVEHCSAALTARGVAHEVLEGAEIRHRWPQWEVPDAVQAVYQEQGGLVDARKANATHVALARARGARLLEETPVLELRPVGGAIDVVTSIGTFSAGRVIIAADAWTNQVLAGLGVSWPLTVTQEQVTYFATPHLREFAPERFPIWIWRAAQEFYGFPVYGEVATKAGQDAGGDEVTPATRTFQPNPRTHRNLRAFLERYLPRSLGPELYTKTCLYTMPPDRNFIVGTLPEHPNVAVAVGAGHAFKFAGLLGHILAQLAMDGSTKYSVEAFALDRPALTDPTYPPQFRNELVHSQ
jgi:sarcosine oxidase